MDIRTDLALPFGRVHAGLVESLVDDGGLRLLRAARGTILTHEGDAADHALLLVDGWLALSKTLATGDRQIIDVMLPGDFAMVGTRLVAVAACSVEALSDIEYAVIRPAQANGPGDSRARLREAMAASILVTQARTSELLLRLGRSSAASRIAYALLELHMRLEALGRTRGATFDFPMTQEKLGEFTGLTNVHVCRTLRRFERAGLIAHPDAHSIALTDMTALCDIADIDLEMLRTQILLSRV